MTRSREMDRDLVAAASTPVDGERGPALAPGRAAGRCDSRIAHRRRAARLRERRRRDAATAAGRALQKAPRRCGARSRTSPGTAATTRACTTRATSPATATHSRRRRRLRASGSPRCCAPGTSRSGSAAATRSPGRPIRESRVRLRTIRGSSGSASSISTRTSTCANRAAPGRGTSGTPVPADRRSARRLRAARSATSASARARRPTRRRCSTAPRDLGAEIVLDVDAAGPPAEAALLRFIADSSAVYLTFCLDVLPPAVAPGVSAPVGPRRGAAPRRRAAARRARRLRPRTARPASCCWPTSPSSTLDTIRMAARRARRRASSTNWPRSAVDARGPVAISIRVGWHTARRAGDPARRKRLRRWLQCTNPCRSSPSRSPRCSLPPAAAARRRRTRGGGGPGRAATDAEAAGRAHLPPGIDWFAGDVDAAFAAAKAGEQAAVPVLGRRVVPALRADQVHDLQQARVPGAQPAVRPGVPRRRHAERAAPWRALRRRGLPDHDPVPAPTAPRSRGCRAAWTSRATRSILDAALGRRAAGVRDPARSRGRRRGDARTTGACSRTTPGATRQRPHPAAPTSA